MSQSKPASLSLVEPLKPSYRLEQKNSVCSFFLKGDWTVFSLQGLEHQLQKDVQKSRTHVVLDLSAVSYMDTGIALFLNSLQSSASMTAQKVEILAEHQWQKQLLNITTIIPDFSPVPSPSYPPFSLFFYHFGKQLYALLDVCGRQLTFFFFFLLALSRQVVGKSSFRFTALISSMEQVGLRAVGIVSLLTFLIGMVVAYMGAQELARFGAQLFAVNLLEVTIAREMGVLITAIVVAGRSSSAFTAQIGAMVANEEVDALRVMGLDPMELLVTPRVLALLFTLPLLVFIADLMALFGGALALWYTIDMNLYAFLQQYNSVAKLSNFLIGICKAPFFAVTIGIVGCYHGFQASHSAESVGFLTTKAVVESIFLVIVIDAIFAILFATLGI